MAKSLPCVYGGLEYVYARYISAPVKNRLRTIRPHQRSWRGEDEMSKLERRWTDHLKQNVETSNPSQFSPHRECRGVSEPLTLTTQTTHTASPQLNSHHPAVPTQPTCAEIEIAPTSPHPRYSMGLTDWRREQWPIVFVGNV